TPWNRAGRAPRAPASVRIGEADARFDALLELLLHVPPLREEDVVVQQILRGELQSELLIEELEREDHDRVVLVAWLEGEAGERGVRLAHPYERLDGRVVEQTIDVAPGVLVLERGIDDVRGRVRKRLVLLERNLGSAGLRRDDLGFVVGDVGEQGEPGQT